MSVFRPLRPLAGQSAFDSLSIFTFLWAVGILTHLAAWRGFTKWHNLPLIVIALATLLRPSSLLRLTALAVAQIVVAGLEMPSVSNHWMLVALTNVTIVTVLVTRPGRQPDGRWDRTAVYHALAPPLRLVILGAYAFAFLAKLNNDFFVARRSCAAEMYRRLARQVTVLPTGVWTRVPAIWFTVTMEGGVPLLLAIRRTRVLGVCVALGFHVILGLAGYYDFSAVTTAFLVLFLPDDMPQRLGERARRYSWVTRCAERGRRLVQSRAALPLAVAVSYGVMTQIHQIEPPLAFMMRVWLVSAALVAIALTVAVLARPRVTGADSHLKVLRPAYLFGPVLIVLNGLSPYIGLKTQYSFTMFANLRTEGPHWNHFVVPRGVRVFGMQDDVVRILASSNSRLSRYVRSRDGLVWQSFLQVVSRDPSMSLVYELHGQRYRVPRVGDDPMLSRPPNPLATRFLAFRTIHRRCGH